MKHETKEVRSYGRCAAGRSQVYHPTSNDEVCEVFKIASKAGCRVTIHGGGHSFDGQAVHDGDDGREIILCTDKFANNQIKWLPNEQHPKQVLLGAGVSWGYFVEREINRAGAQKDSIRLPGSMQTAKRATAGGTLAGDCLSRFSGTMGKESKWISSFRMITVDCNGPIEVSGGTPLFNAVVGGQGCIGFVTDITYDLIEIGAKKGADICAHTTITQHRSFRSFIDKQLALIAAHSKSSPPEAVSSAWFMPVPVIFKGLVFDSVFDRPSKPRPLGYPLYNGIESGFRPIIEELARLPIPNLAIHEVLYDFALLQGGEFEDPLEEFIFFMDGNTFAKKKFEERHQNPQEWFPIVQQTFVIPADKTENFAALCEAQMLKDNVRPTECDMLFVSADDCLLSANYKLDGFAVTLGFELIEPKGCPPDPPDTIPRLLRYLSGECKKVGGRIHLTKNVYVDDPVLRAMFDDKGQLSAFKAIKLQYDPSGLLGNKFYDRFK